MYYLAHCFFPADSLRRWEHTLDEQAVGWLYEFCNSKRNYLLERAEALQPAACNAICRGFTQAESVELVAQGHIFSRHFRADSPQNPPTGLQALVAAADRIQGRTPVTDGDFPHDRSAGNPQSYAQLPDATSDMPGTCQQVRRQSTPPEWQPATELDWPPDAVAQIPSVATSSDPRSLNHSTEASCGSEPGLAPGIASYAHDGASGAPLLSGLQQAGHEKHRQPCQAFGDANVNWAQETMTQHEPFGCDLDLTLDQVNQNGVAVVSNATRWDYDDFCFEWGHT